MDFSTRFEGLQQQVANATATVNAAVTESPDELKHRIDQAQVDQDRAARDVRGMEEAPSTGRRKWDKMRADAASKMNDVKARIDKRNRQMDADMAAVDADMAEDDADAAIDYAAWTVDNARLAVLDAIDARAYADLQAGRASS